MPVWLCKQSLGHKDTSKVEQTGPDDAAIKHAVHVMLSESEREELKASWYDFAAEKRAALDSWADALSCIVEGRRAEIEDYSSRLARLRGTSKVLVS